MWRIVGKSVIGDLHTKVGLPCQDYCATRESTVLPNRRFAALSDGAGSAKYADQGARIAVEVLLDEVSAYAGALKDIGKSEYTAWLKTINDKIALMAEADHAKTDDYAATLLFGIFDGSEGYFWQIGDGAWIVETVNGIEAATWPYIGEYVNETVFITSKNAVDESISSYYPSISRALGFSDGLEHLCLNFANKTPHVPFAGKILSSLRSDVTEDQVLPQIEDLLNSTLVTDRTDDDKTLTLAWSATFQDNANG